MKIEQLRGYNKLLEPATPEEFDKILIDFLKTAAEDFLSIVVKEIENRSKKYGEIHKEMAEVIGKNNNNKSKNNSL